MLKKLILSLVVAIFLLVSITPYFSSAKAQTWYSPTFPEFTQRVFNEDNPDEIFGERYTFAQVTWILHSLTSILVPDVILACFSGSGVGSCIQEVISASPFAQAQDKNKGIAQTFEELTTQNPMSGIGYLRRKLSNAHFIPEAKAQGFGFQNLEPIRQVWVGFRDISYVLLILAFIVMAFMIMFRVKISPQTVITVQSALPRLILILILITFSYAIAGFVVDITYLSLGLLAILGSGLSGLGTLDLFNVLITSLPITTMFILPLVAVLAAFFTGGFFTFPLGGGIIWILGAVIMLLIVLVFAWIMIRIWWLMIKSFINVVLLIALSPILILLGVFPSAGGFGNWLRNLFSHIMVFPAIITMVFIAHFTFWISIQSGPIGDILANITILNPYHIDVGSSGGIIQLPGFAIGDSTLFGIIMAFGILFMVPAIGSIIQGFISGRPFAYGTAIGQAFGPVSVVGGAGLQGVSSLQQQQYEGALGLYRREGIEIPSWVKRFQTAGDVIRKVSGGKIR